jgi:MoaA/NifB/PqqE/SkfB family radical SAM enzyme
MHIEISNRCQASCPMCPRNIKGSIENPLIQNAEWTLSEFKTIFNSDLLEHLEFLTMCGAFGDPMMNDDVLDMCKHLRDTSNITLHLHTNASARKPEWWAELARSMPKEHRVVFALDGLADTQALYRVGTDWHKVIENAKAFISAGGLATWHFVRFRHNEHQVDACRQLAKELGFKTFIVRNTRRFDAADFKVYNRKGKVTHILQQPTDNVIKFVDRAALEGWKSWDKASEMNCYALDTHEIYVDAHRTLLPCCITASFMYTNYDKSVEQKLGIFDPISSQHDIGSEIQQQWWDTINELGGLEALDARKGIKEIMETPAWQTLLKKKWGENGSGVCTVMCSASSPFLAMLDQKALQEELN